MYENPEVSEEAVHASRGYRVEHRVMMVSVSAGQRPRLQANGFTLPSGSVFLLQ